MDTIGGVLVIIGAIMVYWVKIIFKLLKIKEDINKIIIVKLIGLIISTIGILKILQII